MSQMRSVVVAVVGVLALTSCKSSTIKTASTATAVVGGAACAVGTVFVPFGIFAPCNLLFEPLQKGSHAIYSALLRSDEVGSFEQDVKKSLDDGRDRTWQSPVRKHVQVEIKPSKQFVEPVKKTPSTTAATTTVSAPATRICKNGGMVYYIGSDVTRKTDKFCKVGGRWVRQS